MIVIRIIATSYAVVKWLKELSGSLGGKKVKGPALSRPYFIYSGRVF